MTRFLHTVTPRTQQPKSLHFISLSQKRRVYNEWNLIQWKEERRRLRSLEKWDDASVLASRHHLRRRRRKRKITVLLFQIFLPVKLVWKWVCGGDLRLLSWTAWTHVFSLLEKNKNKNTASGGDVRVLFHREDQGNDKPQCTPPHPPSPLHPTLSTSIYSTWPPASVAPHGMSFQYDHTWTRE